MWPRKEIPIIKYYFNTNFLRTGWGNHHCLAVQGSEWQGGFWDAWNKFLSKASRNFVLTFEFTQPHWIDCSLERKHNQKLEWHKGLIPLSRYLSMLLRVSSLQSTVCMKKKMVREINMEVVEVQVSSPKPRNPSNSPHGLRTRTWNSFKAGGPQTPKLKLEKGSSCPDSFATCH